MSSATTAMNRKIASQASLSRDDLDIEPMARRAPETQRPGLKGTPVQQCWQILNFHEVRLNKMDGFLTQSSRETAAHLQSVMNILKKHAESNDRKVSTLEAQLNALRNHVAGLSKGATKKNKGSAVQLEVSDQ